MNQQAFFSEDPSPDEVTNETTYKNIKEKLEKKEQILAEKAKKLPIIELKNLEKNFGSKKVLKSVNAKIYEGEFITILGPSGSGKSTILSLLGGFEYPTRGEIIFQGRDVKDLPSYKRPTSTIFQDYALFPHLDVKGNVKYGLKLIRKPVAELVEKYKDVLKQNQKAWSQKADAEMGKLDKTQAEYRAQLSGRALTSEEKKSLQAEYQSQIKAATSEAEKKEIKRVFKEKEKDLRTSMSSSKRKKMQKWLDDSDFKYSYWENFVNLKTEQFTKSKTSRALTRKEIDERVHLMLSLVGLQDSADSNILALSGGMKQRVALARSLAISPKILLLDEPLSALDAKIRSQMQKLLVSLQEELGLTFIFVTHDQREALELSSRVIVVRDGRIEQFDHPEKIYDFPVNKWVANFIGESNFFDGVYQGDGFVTFLNKTFKTIHTDKEFNKGDKVDVLIRPEDIHLNKKQGLFKGKVVNWTYKGSYYITDVEINDRVLQTESTDFFDVDQEVYLTWDIDDMHLMAIEEGTSKTSEFSPASV
ncbi:ATP-binding cassette domain-containing protein [Mycoplasmopsis agassizii]|uniref:ABC transporter domain-containing protein n=1 Tax=Mycoplasmopsis agassizii TaxID=33922 RepID=A0ABX4H4L8_9BACT|nr:ATP-binding cassette domain-containing protein [Mycoplasmopsis agassizii]PAF54835.1 hypothetical protein CJF60_03815 [Mycoplasmopsis agassizii]SMC18632.1 spermidine/putrescine transport system ATP-binding protein [Mycoplasmopsis agassizii]